VKDNKVLSGLKENKLWRESCLRRKAEFGHT